MEVKLVTMKTFTERNINIHSRRENDVLVGIEIIIDGDGRGQNHILLQDQSDINDFFYLVREVSQLV